MGLETESQGDHPCEAEGRDRPERIPQENAAQSAAVISVLRTLAEEDQVASIEKATRVELLDQIERLVSEID